MIEEHAKMYKGTWWTLPWEPWQFSRLVRTKANPEDRDAELYIGIWMCWV